jgi:hypothetical protein
MKAESEFVHTIKEASGDGAKVEVEIRSAKMSFGDQSMPAEELPKPETKEWTNVGLPKDIDFQESEDPMSFLLPVWLLPNKEVQLGKTFELKFKVDGVTIEGEGTLVATGMLYEEHVSKLSVKTTASPKDDTPGTFEYTAYFNTDNGKLVKAEGTMSSEDPDLGGKFVASFMVAKVRKV